MTETVKVFNTRLEEETIEKIQALAWYKRTTIQAVTQTALDQFFSDRKAETEKALEAYRNQDKGL